MSRKKIVGMALALAAAILSACGQNTVKATMHTSTIFAMDTVMELQIAGDESLLKDAEEKIRSFEKSLSVTDNNSEIAKLNMNGRAELSAETASLMKEALSICTSTQGALDITVYPVLKAWGFTTQDYKVPGDEELQELLQYVDYKNISLSDGEKSSQTYSCEIPEGVSVDLGSVAKGYTSRELADFFTKNGVTSGLINLGGNVQCIGKKTNGMPWKVAIKSPYTDSATGIIGVIDAYDTAIITSGGYERYFEQDGKTYWHIIDPGTGYPAQNGLVSVTIVGKDGLICDGLSTALFVMGLDDAISYYRENGGFDAIFITDDKQLFITQGISDKFTLSSEYYDVPMHVVSK